MKICTTINDLKNYWFERNGSVYEIVGSYPGHAILQNIHSNDIRCVDILDLNTKYTPRYKSSINRS